MARYKRLVEHILARWFANFFKQRINRSPIRFECTLVHILIHFSIRQFPKELQDVESPIPSCGQSIQIHSLGDLRVIRV